MTGIINSSFRRATSIPRKIGVLPENLTSPQKAADIVRGKEAPKKGAVFSKPLARTGSQFGEILNTKRKKDKKGRSILNN